MKRYPWEWAPIAGAPWWWSIRSDTMPGFPVLPAPLAARLLRRYGRQP